MADRNDTLTVDRDVYRRVAERADESAALERAAARLKWWGGLLLAAVSAAGVAWNYAADAGRTEAVENARKEGVDGRLSETEDKIDDAVHHIDANTQAIGANRAEIRNGQRLQIEAFDALAEKLDSMSARGGPVREPPAVRRARTNLGVSEGSQ